jgi:tetratricopeptide (TPR) repeat protein
VYADNYSLVFVRATPENGPLIRELRVQPRAIGDHLEALASACARDPHASSLPYWRNTIAYAYFLKGDFPRAIAYLDEYIALAPQDETARRTRSALERLRGL